MLHRRARQLVLVAGAFWPALASAQLQNPGFDAGGGSLAGWSIGGNVVPNILVSTQAPRSAPADLKLFGQFTSSPNYSSVSQGLPAAGGQTWRARAYLRHNTGDSLVGTENKVLLKIEFYRVFGAAWGSADFLQDSAAPVLDANTPLDTWVRGAMTVRAPPGAVEARVTVQFMQVNNTGGAAFVDDVKLELLPSPWTVVWQDQFFAPTVDAEKWNIRNSGNPANHELQYYAPDEVYTDNGNLVLRSRQRAYGGMQYTSGSVTTLNKYNIYCGRIEVRAKTPWGKGFWPAHWLLPCAGEWPPEIDLMEQIGTNTWCVTMSQHWPPLGPNGEPPWQIGHTANTVWCGVDFAADFHTFTLEWYPGQLYWYIDDVLRFQSARAEVPSERMYLILNTAVGGDWPGAPDGGTPFPAYHLIDYVRVSVPSDPGDALAAAVDTTQNGAVADGVINAGEYAASATGINYGLGDRLGRNSTLAVKSSGDGQLNFALQSYAPFFTTGTWGIVIYIDSVSGGWEGTQQLTDVADLGRRLVSGKGPSGQRSDLYFALGFTADYALVLLPTRAEIYQLGRDQHVLIDAADLGAARDAQGGSDLVYRVDDGSAGGTIRELQLRLWQIGAPQMGAFRYFATVLNGDLAFRANEFIGVAARNAWDGAANPGANPVLLKPGDFLQFQTAPRRGDYNADGRVDFADFTALQSCLAGPALARPSGCLNPFDFDADGDVDIVDGAAFQAAVDSAATP